MDEDYAKIYGVVTPEFEITSTSVAAYEDLSTAYGFRARGCLRTCGVH